MNISPEHYFWIGKNQGQNFNPFKCSNSNPPVCCGDWGGCALNWVADKERMFLVLPCGHILYNSVCYLYSSRNRK